jgi:hypothetical protein
LFAQRTADWNGLDVRAAAPNNLLPGDEIVVVGRVSNAVPSGAQMTMNLSENPWTMLAFANVSSMESFELRHIVRAQDISAAANFRIQTNAAGAEMPFAIDHILITRPSNFDCDNCNKNPCECIIFNANGGEFVNADDAIRFVEDGESVGELPKSNSSTFMRDGYRFMGWYENPEDLSTRWSNNSEVSGGITLHARWVAAPANFILGNVYGDDRITSADATMIARYLVGQEVDICLFSADINGDGEVTIADIILLARWLVGHNVSHLLAN